MSSFDPPFQVPNWASINPRPFIPLQRPPELSFLPSLPSPPRQPIFSNLYTLSTHIIPAAYPRVSLDVPQPEQSPITAGINQSERKKINSEKTLEILAAKQRQSIAEPTEGSKKPLWNCINRYVNRDLEGRQGLTLFLVHANGFPKEARFFVLVSRLSEENLFADLGTFAAPFALGCLVTSNR